MSIIADIKGDLQLLWGTSKWPTKLFVLVSLFMAISSVTSLADTVFKWKGFILEGLKFYHEWIQAPAIHLLKLIGVALTPSQVDSIILLFLVTYAFIRAAILANNVNKVLKFRVSLIIELAVVYFFTILVIFKNAIYISGTVILLINGAIGSVSEKRKEGHFGLFTISFWGFLIFILISVCILAAVNAGLRR